MQEESEPMSEDEASDSEIILVDQSPPRQSLSHREQRIRERKSRIVTEEMKIDQQLKILGLYEEGMNIEQKEELLAVLAVSRETAEQEETMRRKAKEWEKHLYFSDEGEEMGYESYEHRWRSNRSNAGLLPSPSSSDHTKSPPCISEDDIKAKNLSAFKKKEESPSKNKPLVRSVEMLDVDEDTQPVGSQELFVNSSQTKELSPYKSDSEPCQQVQNSETSEDGKERKQVARRGRRRLSRSACQASSSSRIAVAHPILRNLSGTGEGESDQENQMDFHKQKLDLDRNMAFWRPCTSPIAPSLCYRRKAKELKENVPYFCPENSTPQEYIYSILQSFRDYHLKLPKVQKKSPHFIPWGDPVVVGRHHSGTLDVMKRGCQGRNAGETNKMSDAMLQLARYHNTANEVEYPEADNDCDNLTLPELDKWPQSSSSDMECKNIVRTVKSAFRPIKTPVKKENHCIEETASYISQNESSNQNVLQPNIDNHSVPANKVIENKESVEIDSHGNNHLGQQMSDVDDHDTEQVRNKDAERSPPCISLWSPFQQTDYRLPSTPDNYKNAEEYLDIGETNKIVSEERAEYINSNADTFEKQVKITEVDDKNTDLCVRKDGQRTYASRHQLKQQNNNSKFGELIQITEIPESQESSDMTNESHEIKSSSNSITTLEEDNMNVEQKNMLDKIEQDANKRKRKCDVSKISSDSSKNDSPRKRSCHTTVDKPVSVGNT